ncbi:cellulose synthase/poly-beta-1,6-N-acetylglucosamine synthase-like glycosyltransferase [Weissella uvarum]|uniref:hypothetical protein n=1 Tax=Weissella uvarum TaxID=1479233 RepID=UPI0019603C6E|nr:hypothetical protein [Weissella uvarum]MBM7617336.1 cellulose synthase/poly-beta-1,6-N-acetylglucosamine synthase-like glycosyltransferase [Weissella uvarum]MCM0595772.1 hypothetical protein [Weissella uvarum]
MPEKISGLFKQRLRWAQGGAEVLLHNLNLIFKPKDWPLLPLLLEQLVSTTWCLLWYVSLFIFIKSWIVMGYPNRISIAMGALLVATCLVQFMTALYEIKKVDDTATRYLYWGGWYPIFYWIINPVTTQCWLCQKQFGVLSLRSKLLGQVQIGE